MKRAAHVLCGVGLIASSLPAMAHPFHGVGGGFAAGFAHPFLGLDHLLAMVAVGVWAVQQAGSSTWRLPLAFCAAMAIGVGLGHLGFAITATESLIAASVLILGLAILSARRIAPAWAIPLVAFFALFHGMAHAMESPAGAPWLALAGLLSATLILHLTGIGTAAALRNRIRIAGAPLMITGAWLLSRALA